jgi:hypothetical protein
MCFSVVSTEVARPILERFHYLLSFREGAIHLGLKFSCHDSWPVALVSLSPFDLSNIPLEYWHPVGEARKCALVLSRVFGHFSLNATEFGPCAE